MTWRLPKKHVPVFNLLGHRQESLLDIRCILSGRLKEWDIQLVGEFLVEILMTSA